MDLEKTQREIIEGIFGGDKGPAAEHIKSDEKLSAEERLDIYGGSVNGILTQALSITFPVLKALVGEKFFNNMVSLFINKHPPKSALFAEYGGLLPSFLSTFEPVKDIPYISDVARFEWARQEVYHQKHEEGGNLDQLAHITEEQQANLTFDLSKTVQLIKSDFRVDDIWFAHQDGSEIDLEEIELNKTVKLSVWKDEDKIKVSLMSETQEDNDFWDFLDAVSKNTPLVTLAEKFGNKLPEYLNQCIQSGWIRSFSTS